MHRLIVFANVKRVTNLSKYVSSTLLLVYLNMAGALWLSSYDSLDLQLPVQSVSITTKDILEYPFSGTN